MIYNFSPTCQITGLDEIYKKYFGDKENGVFVEVGAFDGETHSNTSGLADAGWIGLYIEPVPEYADMCQKRHKDNNVVVLENMAGDKMCSRQLKVAGELSTSIDDPASMYKSAGLDELYHSEDLDKVITVQQMPLDSLIEVAGCITPLDGIDLLVLDCEGTEWDVLRVFKIKDYEPTMVIVEMHEDSIEWQSIPSVKLDTERINKYMSDNGYHKIHSDPINTIFVKEVK